MTTEALNTCQPGELAKIIPVSVNLQPIEQVSVQTSLPAFNAQPNNVAENKASGYIKAFRSLKRKAWYTKDGYAHLFIHLLLSAAHAGYETWLNGRSFLLKPGQLVVGRRKLEEQTGINEHKIDRILKVFQRERIIEQQTFSTCRLISILNWGIYQTGEPDLKPDFTQVASQGQAINKPVVSTIQEGLIKEKNIKKIKSPLVIASDDSSRKARNEYENLVKNLEGKNNSESWNAVKSFINDNKPDFIDPFMDAWNLFAISKKLIKQPQLVTDKRRKKFSSRIKEPGFDFFKILEAIQKSEFLRGNNDRGWTVSIEFILESQENYTKILEGKYS